MTGRPHWRAMLDPRDPDYEDPEVEREDDDPVLDYSDDDLARAACEAENHWRPSA